MLVGIRVSVSKFHVDYGVSLAIQEGLNEHITSCLQPITSLLYILLRYAVSLVDEVFSVDILMGGGFPSEVEELVTHFVVTCYDKAYVDTDQYVTYGNLRGTAIALVLRVRGGGYIIMRSQKTQNSIASNTVPVTIVPHTFIQAPVFLVRTMRRRSVTLRSLTSYLTQIFRMP